MKKILLTLGLLTLSNAFMNVAWYGHLKFKESPIYVAILASWGIALFEYCFQVPANRIGNGTLTITQLKIAQEVISLTTFAIFSMVAFGTKFSWNHALAFLLIIAAAALVVKG